MEPENPLDVSGYNEQEKELELAETTVETLVEVNEKDDDTDVIKEQEEENDSKSREDSKSKDDQDSQGNSDTVEESTQRTLGLINFSKRL